MTLSAFLKNYLYIPLGGNRCNSHMRNILITMFLGGLWHGAGWTFIFWGVLHGIFICINHLWRKTNIQLPKFVNWLLTFNAVNLAWIFFRANSFESAMSIVKAMFDINRFVVPYSYGLGKYIDIFKHGSKLLLSSRDIVFIVGCLVIAIIALDKKYVEKINVNVSAVVISLLLLYSILSMGQVTEFLYFQF